MEELINEKELNLKEKVDELYALKENPKIKKKKIRLPRKARVKKKQIKKGWVGILKVDENGNLSGEKVKIEGSAYKLKSGTFHAIEGNNNEEGQEILFWNGKYPVIVQETKKKNPKLFNGGKNETYGQPYIQALMLNDQLSNKKKGIGAKALIWVALAVVAFFVIKTLMDRGSI